MTSLFNEVVPQPDVILIMTKYSAGSKNIHHFWNFASIKNISSMGQDSSAGKGAWYET